MALPLPRTLAGRLAGGMFSSLGVADYRRVFFGNMAFQFNVWMQQLTFGWLLLLIGNSPFWLGLNGFVSGLAMIVMGPIGGALADAWERRRAMMLTQLTAVVVNATIALLYWLGWLAVWHLLLASLMMSISFTLNMPARQALMGEIVPKPLLHNAVALHTASMNFNRVMGPSVAGVLLSVIGPLWVMLVNLVANCWTVTQLLSIRHRPTRAPRPFRPHIDDLLEGFRFCWRTRPLFEAMIVIALTNLFGMSFVQLMPSFARDSLGVGPEGLGVLTASMGGGALVGSLLLARLPEIPNKPRMLRGAAMLAGLLVLVLGQAPSVLLATPVLALIGAGGSVTTALGIQMVQQYVPEELSGRVFGVYMLTMALMPLGSLPAGALADQVGTATAISLWGAVGSLVIGGLLAARLVSERRAGTERIAPTVGT